MIGIFSCLLLAALLMLLLGIALTAFYQWVTPKFTPLVLTADTAHGPRIEAANAAALADTLTKRGLRIVSGRTESHVMLVDLRPKNLTGKEAEAILGAAHITCNKNGIPNDPQKPMVTSGIRLGSPAMTTRGFKEEQAVAVGNLIADVLDNPHDEATIARVREQVSALTRQFPVYSGKAG